jgi:hypothetical protein
VVSPLVTRTFFCRNLTRFQNKVFFLIRRKGCNHEIKNTINLFNDSQTAQINLNKSDCL